METAWQAAPAPLPRHPHGLERGKYLFGEPAEAGAAAFCIGVYPLTHDKEILPIPRTAVRRGAARHRGPPRPRHAAARVGAEHDRRHRRPDLPRRALRRRTRGTSCGRPSSRGAAMGLEPQMAFELEFYLWSPTRSGGWVPVPLPVAPRLRHRHVDRSDRRVDDIVEAAQILRVPARELGQRVRQRRPTR